MLCLVLFSAVLFYSCGNPLLNLDGTGSNPDTPPDASFKTTDEDVPNGVTPIYIDTQAQFQALCSIGMYGAPYEADDYFILRGNGVANRTFTVTQSIIPTVIFTGTLTGWYKDKDQKTTTTIRVNHGESFFPKMDGATVSWLKFEAKDAAGTDTPISKYTSNGYAGIIAAETEGTKFEYVSAFGSVAINIPVAPTTAIYAGGFVGKADTGTEFESCITGAQVSVIFASSSENGYVGGFAGVLTGSVKNSTVSSISNFGYSQPITVSLNVSTTSGASKTLYAGGVVGTLEGTVTNTDVWATVSARGKAETVYAGGFAGSLTNGGINNNSPTGIISVTAGAGAASGEIVAGGLVGIVEGTGTLNKNRVSGQLSVRSIYYDSHAYSGGLVGKLTNGASISESSINTIVTVQSYAESATSTTGKAYAGGLAGFSQSGCSVEKSSFTSQQGGVSAGFNPSPLTVTGFEAYAGGIVGYAQGTISTSYASVVQQSVFSPASPTQAGIDARVTQTDGIAAAGGITGGNDAEISKSYAVVMVKARANNATSSDKGAMAGGISGMSQYSISQTFALAQVDARPIVEPNPASKAMAGGIVGLLIGATASIKESYAAGSASATTAASVSPPTAQAGGIAGLVNTTAGGVVIERCVALQRYAEADSTTDYHRVVGKNNGTGTFSNNHAYERMRRSTNGTFIDVPTPPVGTDENGLHIDDVQAITINVYQTSPLSWATAVWKASSYYPILDGLDAPTFYTWAQIP
jgi:hypothetical protein